jgi:nucleotide-binding universal stress UspA family protein
LSENQPFRIILIPLALAGTDDELLRHGAYVVRMLRLSEVHFVHVRGSRAPGRAEQARMALVEIVSSYDFPVSAQQTYNVYSGAIEDRLLEYAREHKIDLILLGHQRTHSRHRALARRLAMHAPCSIWVVPEGCPVELSGILVPVDFSPSAADALQLAVSLARSNGLDRISALHVRFNEAAVSFDEYEDILEGQEHRAMDEFVSRIDLKGVAVDCVLEEAAHVATAIDRVAERQPVDLVVMSTRGRSPAAAVLLGSQTEQVLIESPRPVLVVKHSGSQLNILEALFDREFAKQGVRFS